MALRFGAALAEEAPLLEANAMRFGRVIGRGLRPASRFGRAGYRAMARAAGKVYRVGKKNPFMAGMAAQSLLSKVGGKRKKGGGRKFGRPLGPVRPKKKSKTSVGKAQALAVASQSGRFAKLKTPAKLNAKFTKRHFDDYGTVTRNHGAWIGFQKFGNSDRLYGIVGEAVARAILATVKIYPSSYNEVLINGAETDLSEYVQIEYKRVNNASGEEGFYTGGDITLLNKTFEEFATAVADDIRGKSFGSILVDPGSDTVGYYPYRFTVKHRIGGTIYDKVKQRHLGSSRLTLAVTQVIKIQNVSPNDDGTNATDVNGTNPISGRQYDFDAMPRVHDEVVKTNDYLEDLQQHMSHSSGCIILPQTATNTDSVIGHPPKAREIFKNCVGSRTVSIEAGGQKYTSTKMTWSGTLEQFVRKHQYTGFTRPNMGGTLWFGFEQAFRQGSDVVKFGFNRELSMSCSCQLRPVTNMLRHYDQTDLGDLL